MGVSATPEGEQNAEAPSPTRSPSRRSPSPTKLAGPSQGKEESKEESKGDGDGENAEGGTAAKKKQDTDGSDDELEAMDAGQYVQMV